MRYPGLLIYIIIFALLLSACGQETAVPTPAATTATVSPEPVETLVPTGTPTVTPEPLTVYLLAPAEADPQLVAQVEPLIQEAALQAGVLYQRAAVFDTGRPPQNAAAVVLVPPAPAQELAASAPGVRFIAIGYGVIDPPDNLLVPDQFLPEPDEVGFAAGYAAAVISADWRIGIMTVSDTEAGVAARDAFLNGAEYFCGLCRPAYPPYFDDNSAILEYPTYVELPAASTAQDWLAAAQWLIDRPVEVVYVGPGAGDPASIQALSDAGVKLIASSVSPTPGPAAWAASIGGDPLKILAAVLPGVITGSPGPDSLPGLMISNADQQVFGAGKQQLVEELITEIEAGRIQTLPLP